MSVSTTSSGDVVEFSQTAISQSSNIVSIICTYNISSLTSREGGANGVILNFYSQSAPFCGWSISTENSVNRIYFIITNGGGTPGLWYITNPGLSTIIQMVILYDGSSTSNNPSVYVNGISQSVTKQTTPSSQMLMTNSRFLLFNRNDSVLKTQTLTGSIYQICVYNRILSAAEIADAYNSKLAIPSYRGLVFSPQLWNIQDGAVLGSSNIIRDLVSGAAGVPSGSPVGRGDNVLRIEGIN